MKVYVSMSSENLTEAKEWMARLEDHGHEVFDWTNTFGTPESEWSDVTEKELAAVAESKALVLVGSPTAECMAEVGVAVANKVPIFYLAQSAEGWENRPFFLHNRRVFYVGFLDTLWSLLDLLRVMS